MILEWDIYEISSPGNALHGVMLRGRIRKFALEKEITCLVENAEDKDNVVRFALISGAEHTSVADYVISILPDAVIEKVEHGLKNPVLSKMKVNDHSRY